MNKKFLAFGVAVTITAGYSLSAFSQAKPETLVRQRQAAMILQGKYFNGHLRLMGQGKIPYDANAAARSANYLAELSRMAWDGFTPETKGVKSAALPAIYTDTAKFKELADRFQSESSKLVSVIKSGDEAAVRNQIGVIDKVCGSCHESFRERQ